jgi:hypothetical protein
MLVAPLIHATWPAQAHGNALIFDLFMCGAWTSKEQESDATQLRPDGCPGNERSDTADNQSFLVLPQPQQHVSIMLWRR